MTCPCTGITCAINGELKNHSLSLNFNEKNINFNNLNFINSKFKDDIILYIINTLSILDSFHDFAGKRITETSYKNKIAELLGVYCKEIIRINKEIYNRIQTDIQSKNILDNFNKIEFGNKGIQLINFTELKKGYLTDQNDITYSNVNDPPKKKDFYPKFIDFIKKNLIEPDVKSKLSFETSIKSKNEEITKNFKILFPNNDKFWNDLTNLKKIIKCRNILYLLINNITNNDYKTILLNELNIPSNQHENPEWIIDKNKIESLKVINTTYPTSYILDESNEDDLSKEFWNKENYWNFSWYFSNKDIIDPNVSQLSPNSLVTGSTETIAKKFIIPNENRYTTKMKQTEIKLGNNNHIFKANETAFENTRIQEPYLNATIEGEVFSISKNEVVQIAEELNKLDESNIKQICALFGFKRFGDWFQIAQTKHTYKEGYFILKTGDFWCNIAAIFTGCPCILNGNLYNINYNPTRLDIELFKITDVDLLNLEKVDDNKELQVKKPQSYTLPKGNLTVLINKYLKYKFKYLKQKKQIDINNINNIIKSTKIELYNNINNINYENIKQKYLKYKTKYLLLKK